MVSCNPLPTNIIALLSSPATLGVDPHKTNETIVKPYDYGISLANKDIVELKVTLADFHTTTKK